MKNSALEVLKASAISNIEKRVDLLLAAKKIAYEGEVAPVRKPQHRQMRTLEQIDEKLALLVSAMGLEAEEQPLVPETAEPLSEATEGETRRPRSSRSGAGRKQSSDKNEEPAETE